MFMPFPAALRCDQRTAQSPAAAGIDITTPASPQPPGKAILVCGTHPGSPEPIRLSWCRGQETVGRPTDVSPIAEREWSAIVVTPDAPGDYVLRVVTSGGTPMAESLPVTVRGPHASARTLASFGFEGSGLPGNTIALFGHAFEQGAVQPSDLLVLRRADIATPLRTQLNVLSQWPDNSIKTALMAAELSPLADGATLEVTLNLGEMSHDPGPALSLATLLSGRTAAIKTWAPGNTTAPLWTYDPLAAIGPDRWHSGSLAVSTRVEAPMPSTANTTSRESVRLVVDVIATKDGFLELDVCFSNDRLPYTSQNQTAGGFANCGPATFGYTIEIDGVIVYDQRPASGAGTTLLQYSQWIRRRGRNPAGSVIGWNNHRPFFRPDLAALVRAGVQHNYLTARPIDAGAIAGSVDNVVNSGATQETNPYHSWGLNRQAGAVGGRPEIGHRPFWGAVWLTSGLRNAQILSHRAFEAAATRPMYWRDWEENDWIYPETWPRFTVATGAGTSPPGTPKNLVNSTPQQPTHNQGDHITIDSAHHGAFNVLPALLEGRRLAYDSMAARASWVTISNNVRHVPGAELPLFVLVEWRGRVAPSHATGAAWGPRVGAGQTRSQSWNFRCLVDTSALLPDTWPFRERYNRHLLAWVNAMTAQIPAVYSTFDAAMGAPFFHTSGTTAVNYMMHFAIPSLWVAQRMGVGGPNFLTLVEAFVRSRVAWIRESGFNHRNYMRGNSFTWQNVTTLANAKSWVDVNTFTSAWLGDTPADWSSSPGEGDYHRNGNMALANLAYAVDLPLELRAMAADALVLCWSERVFGSTPTSEPGNFYGANFQTNACWPVGLTTERNAAPVIPAGQSFPVSAGAANGTILGVVQVTNTVPRNSAPGRANGDAFVIVSQPAGNPVSISMGGVLRVANAGAIPASPFTVQVYCRTWEQRQVTDPNVERRSATVAVTITPR